MLRSMYAGISGMKNSQTKLDVIGNNIANVNTYGFKKGRVTFKEALSQTISGASGATDNRGGKNAAQVGLGSTLATIDTIHTNSTLQTTGRSLDLGIDGDGYFTVRQGDSLSYTRAGNFYLDSNGTLVNGDGLSVQAFKYDNTGKLTTKYGDVTINVNAVLPAVATNEIKLSENLAADATKGSIYSQQIKVIDGDGRTVGVTLYFKKLTDPSSDSNINSGEWGLYINQDPKKLDANDAAATISFNDDGTSQGINPNILSIPTNQIDGVTEVTVNLNFASLTHLKGATTAVVNPNGNTEGKLESYNISTTGEINGVYSNGEISLMGQIAIAKFSNTSGLTQAGNNLFQESINSGTPDISIAGKVAAD